MTLIGIIGIAVIVWLCKELDLLGYCREKIHQGTRKGE